MFFKFENAFDADWCQKAINYFEKMDKMGFGFSRQQLNGSLAHIQDTINVNTTRLVTSGVMDMSIVGVPMIQDYFLQRAWQYFEIYSDTVGAGRPRGAFTEISNIDQGNNLCKSTQYCGVCRRGTAV